MNFLRRTTPLFAAILVGLAFASVLALPILADPDHTERLFIPPAVLAVFMTALSFLLVGGRVHPYHRLRMAITPVILLSGAYGYLLTLDRPWARIAVTALVVAVAYAYFDRLRTLASLEQAEKAEFVYFTYALHVAAAFFVFAAAYGLARIAHVSIALMSPLVAVALVVMTFETLRRAGIRAGRSAPVGVAFGIIATELFVAVAFLPTSYLVNAAVLTVLFSLILRIGMQVLGNEADTARMRRQAVLSFALVIVLLATARWI